VLQRRLVCDYRRFSLQWERLGFISSLLPRANKNSSQTIYFSTETLTKVIVGPIIPIAKKVFNNHTPDGAPKLPKIIN
jgi:hypothetical protein